MKPLGHSLDGGDARWEVLKPTPAEADAVILEGSCGMACIRLS